MANPREVHLTILVNRFVKRLLTTPEQMIGGKIWVPTNEAPAGDLLVDALGQGDWRIEPRDLSVSFERATSKLPPRLLEKFQGMISNAMVTQGLIFRWKSEHLEYDVDLLIHQFISRKMATTESAPWVPGERLIELFHESRPEKWDRNVTDTRIMILLSDVFEYDPILKAYKVYYSP